MNHKQFNISPCVDVVLHGICRHNPIEPKIGQEFTIEGTTYACKKCDISMDYTSSCLDCDMPGHLCIYMECCANHRTDNNNVTFIKLS